MDKTFNERIDTLRKKSRLLLAQVDKNSKKLKKEIKKLYSQNLALREDHECQNQHFGSKRNNKSWHLRNDSSSVNAALHTDCTCSSYNCTLASMPNTVISKKLLTSKKHCDEQCCPKNINRKPIKECYCNPEVKKIQRRSTRTQQKNELPCRYCKSYNFSTVTAKDDTEKSLLSSPISCETLRRVQSINYAPRSQFLRNVQSKVTFLQSAGDGPEPCFRSPCYQKLTTKKNICNAECFCLSTADKESQTRDHVTKSSLLSESSKKSASDVVKAKQKGHSPSSEKSDAGRGKNIEYLTDRELKELKKFREQHYFDTHGSNDTLHSSKSSGSLEQYELNDRLFPERAKSVHKKDLVVTMPACSTLQRKRIHYFPRYIVRQDKANFNTNYKKKRCQSCPLTGHAIDLGITKTRSPLNSLALKYQKQLP